MSGWDAWLPQITGVGFAGGLMISADGAFLAATPGYVATAAECLALANKFKNPDTWSATPTTFQGQKYLALACNDHTAEFKMGTKGASGFKTARGTTTTTVRKQTKWQKLSFGRLYLSLQACTPTHERTSHQLCSNS